MPYLLLLGLEYEFVQVRQVGEIYVQSVLRGVNLKRLKLIARILGAGRELVVTIHFLLQTQATSLARV